MADSHTELAKRWRERIAGSSQKAIAGVDRVDVSPTEKAAAKADKYQAGVIDAVTSGRYQSGLRKVSLQDWKAAMKTKGIPRMAQGAQMAEAKFANFMGQFMPQVRQIQAEVNSMPDGSFEERTQKMVANAQALHNLKGTFT